MVEIVQTIFIGLIIMLPSLYAVILKAKLNLNQYKLDYYRNQSIKLNATIRRHLRRAKK